MRLNRFLARAGVASRRRCDELIAAGAVRVNGAPPSGPGDRVDPARDRVELDGQGLVALPSGQEYVLLHKRRDSLVTRSDERGRRTVYDELDVRPSTVAVGRLDRDTTGALLLTDDGELAYRLMHPSYGAEKRYVAVVHGHPGETSLDRLRRGVELEDGITAPARVQRLSDTVDGRGRIELVLKEGRKHQVKRMCLAVGHRVVSLRRESFAGLVLGDLRAGQWRRLRGPEVTRLQRSVGLAR
jgi:pseudouridine synthase